MLLVPRAFLSFFLPEEKMITKKCSVVHKSCLTGAISLNRCFYNICEFL